jgi:hypothetical protein
MLLAQYRYKDGGGVFEEHEAHTYTEAENVKERLEREFGIELTMTIVDENWTW